MGYLDSNDENIFNNSLYRFVGKNAGGVGSKIWNFIDPAKPYDQEQAGLLQGSQDAKALSQLQWAQQMAGLQQALGHSNHAQGILNALYGAKSNALPVGMGPNAQGPTTAKGPQPGPGIQGAGLGAYFNKRLGG